MPAASRRLAAVVSALCALTCAGCGGGDPPPPPAGAPRNPVPLLERAIAALGGRERLEAIRTLESRAVIEDGPMRYVTRMQVRLPDAYRDEVETESARFVRVWRDGEGWASFDGVPYEVSEEEAASVRQSLRLIGLSLLVNLNARFGATVKELPPIDGCERLEVRFSDDPSGPFELWFDAATLRLKRIAWEAVFVGKRGRRAARYELEDWRVVQGVAAAFRARLVVDGAPPTDARMESLALNPTLLADLFDRPSDAAPVLVRDLDAETIALWENRGAEGAKLSEAEDRLREFVQARGLERRGPVFRVLAPDDAPPAVGVAVVPPKSETRPTTTHSDSLRVTTRPAGRVLTLALRGADAAALRTAAARLAAEADERGLAPAGPCRVVDWSAELTQLQLPVRPR